LGVGTKTKGVILVRSAAIQMHQSTAKAQHQFRRAFDELLRLQLPALRQARRVFRHLAALAWELAAAGGFGQRQVIFETRFNGERCATQSRISPQKSLSSLGEQ
jgi:hypothetical protein